MSASDPCIPFGKKLRKIREESNISQEELAELSGLDRTYISGVERGKRNISLRNIFKLSNALQISAPRLMEI